MMPRRRSFCRWKHLLMLTREISLNLATFVAGAVAFIAVIGVLAITALASAPAASGHNVRGKCRRCSQNLLDLGLRGLRSRKSLHLRVYQLIWVIERTSTIFYFALPLLLRKSLFSDTTTFLVFSVAGAVLQVIILCWQTSSAILAVSALQLKRMRRRKISCSAMVSCCSRSTMAITIAASFLFISSFFASRSWSGLPARVHSSSFAWQVLIIALEAPAAADPRSCSCLAGGVP
mmetsp:Transcript_65475/g.116163  ORF Transcript_65475/g.116163 Transcript_65475/m.116163 type:complete len:234 (-) Transcript_65475:573-1274(-)